MSSIITPFLDQLLRDVHNKREQFFYHYPSQGRMSGWAIAIGECAVHEIVSVAGVIEALALAVINALGASCVSSCPSCRTNFKKNLNNLKIYGLMTLLAIPKLPIDLLVYWNKAEENRNKIQSWGWKPIHFAAAYNDTAYINTIDATIILNDETSKIDLMNTPLHLAVKYGQKAALQALIRQGADLSKRNLAEFTPLDSAVVMLKNNTISLLAKAGADMNAKNKYGYAPIHHAVMERFELPEWASIEYQRTNLAPTIQTLHAHGANVNARADNRENTTALMLAAMGNKPHAVAALLSVNANPNLVSSPVTNQMTALHFAVDRSRQGVVDVLVKHPLVDMNAQEAKNHWTPFHFAAMKATPEMINKLACHSTIQVNSQDRFGRTAYHIAYQKQLIYKQNISPVLNKLSELCDVNIPDNYRKKAADYQADSSFGCKSLFEQVSEDFNR